MNYKERILEKGLKCNFIARKIGVKKSIFSMYVNGKVKIPQPVIDGLEAILK